MLSYEYLQNFSEKINSHLLIALIFVIPFSTALGSIFSALILVFWLINGKFSEQYHRIKGNKVVIASLMIFVLHIVGLLWTADIDWGLQMLKKQWKFLMIPIFMLYVKKEHIRYYIYAFVLAMSISEAISYGIWFELIEPFMSASVNNPTPFMTHITYNPLLAIAIYLIASDMLFHRQEAGYKQWLYLFFLITMTVNMFITGGRSGQVMLFLVILILSLQYFGHKNIKSLVFALFIGGGVFFLAYTASPLFHERVNMAVNNTLNYEEKKNSSVGRRISFALNGMQVFASNPIIGVGTGDLPSAMKVVHKINTPEVKAPDNPHNMYVMWLVQFGLTGLLALLWLFYVQVQFALSNANQFMKRLGVTLPALFFVANFGESYLSIHSTSLLFAVFSAVVYSKPRTT